MSKFVGKFRQRDYFTDEDEYNTTKNFIKTKKRRSEGAELKKLRMQQYEEDNYGYEDRNSKKNNRYAKL